MKNKTFLISLSILSLLTTLGLLLAHRTWPILQPYAPLSWIGLSFFFLLTLATYYLGKMTAGSKNLMAFTNLTLGLVFGKMILAMLIVFAYAHEAKPQSKLFLVPFFSIYLVYTIFETWILLKLSSIKPSKP